MGLSHDNMPSGSVSTTKLAMAALLAWGVLLGWLVGNDGWLGTLGVLGQDATVALLIFVSAGGWGWALLRWVLPAEAGAGLKAVTYVGAGLWLLGSALLAAGSAAHGALSAVVWWPIVGGGLALAAVAAASYARGVRLPSRVDGVNVLWLLAALAAGFWAAGAAMPPGFIGRLTGDFYDVISYHLQIPAEHYRAGRIGFLEHNTYGNYPGGGEMLFLLGMVLRGGPQVGAFAAKFTHGLWGVLAAAGLYYGLPSEQTWRRRTAAVLLATLPGVVYLSWLAFVELSELAYLAIGLAWLLRWRARPTVRHAVLVGLGAGGACATKYLSVGLVAGPLLAVMLGLSIVRPRRLGGFLAAAAVCAAMMLPWLIRNWVYTGNPVFPLLTGLLGRGHWSAESAAMWDAAHASPPLADKGAAALRMLLDERMFSLLTVLLFAAAAAWTIARGRRSDATDWICLALAAMQAAVWAFGTHMAGRFLIPAAVPMVVLIGGFTTWLSAKAGSAKTRARSAAPPGLALAALLVLFAGGFNLLLVWRNYRAEPYTRPVGGRLQGWAPDEIFNQLPEGEVIYAASERGPILLVGDIRPYLFPPNTKYATVWERDPLLNIVRQTDEPAEIIRRLKAPPVGAAYLWVNWAEIDRLHQTYRWWPQINRGLIADLLTAGATVEYALTDNGRLIAQLIALPPDATSQPATARD